MPGYPPSADRQIQNGLWCVAGRDRDADSCAARPAFFNVAPEPTANIHRQGFGHVLIRLKRMIHKQNRMGILKDSNQARNALAKMKNDLLAAWDRVNRAYLANLGLV